MDARSISRCCSGKTETPIRTGFRRTKGFASGTTTLLPDTHGSRASRHCHQAPERLGSVRRRHQWARTSLLPQHRRQDRALSRCGASPGFPRARGTGYLRDVRERSLNVASCRCSAGVLANHPWARVGTYDPTWIRHRVRLLPANRTRCPRSRQNGSAVCSWPDRSMARLGTRKPPLRAS